ncbi:MAG: hypothetical protein HFG01_03510 [Oscillibacter sp.]|nr:hypothetical protein [Oscillibacter sp.]
MDYAGWELERQRAALAALLLGETAEEGREAEASLRSPGGGRRGLGAVRERGGRQAGMLRAPAAEEETAVRRAEGGWFFLRTESGTGGGGTGVPPTETAENETARNVAAKNGTAEKGTAESGTETGQAVLLRLEEFGPETPGDVRFFAAGLRSSAGPREAGEQWLSPVLRAEEGRLSGGGEAEREAARAISLAVQRDARRYDGGFAIY